MAAPRGRIFGFSPRQVMDYSGVIFVLFLFGLALWWIVRSALRRRALRKQVTQLTGRVYALEQDLKTLSKLVSGLAKHAVTPEEEPVMTGEQTTGTAPPPTIEQFTKPSYAPRADLTVLPASTPAPAKETAAPETIASEAEAAVPAPQRSPSIPTARARPQPPEAVQGPATELHTPASRPPGFPTLGQAKSILNLEETLGANWLNKLGIAIFVIGVAALSGSRAAGSRACGQDRGGMRYRRYLAGRRSLLREERAVPHPSARRHWRRLGANLLYAYAMYHVPASHVLSSQ